MERRGILIMAVTIKLNDDPSTGVFASGGVFEGTPRNRAKLMLAGLNTPYVHNKVATGTAAQLSYDGGQKQMMISTRGTSISDYSLEQLLDKGFGWGLSSTNLIEMVEQGYVLVYEDGVLQTATALRSYSAP